MMEEKTRICDRSDCRGSRIRPGARRDRNRRWWIRAGRASRRRRHRPVRWFNQAGWDADALHLHTRLDSEFRTPGRRPISV